MLIQSRNTVPFMEREGALLGSQEQSLVPLLSQRISRSWRTSCYTS